MSAIYFLHDPLTFYSKGFAQTEESCHHTEVHIRSSEGKLLDNQCVVMEYGTHIHLTPETNTFEGFLKG